MFSGGNFKAIVEPALDHLDVVDVKQSTPAGLADFYAREITARTIWGAALLIQTLAFVTGIFVSVSYILARCRCAAVAKAFATIMLSVLAVTAIYCFTSSRNPQNSACDIRAAVVIQKLLDTAVYNTGKQWLLNHLIDFENALAMAFMVLNSFAVCSILLHRTQLDGRPLNDSSIMVSIRSNIRGILSMSAIILVIGVLQIGFEYRWAITSLQPKVTAKLGVEVASGTTLAFGFVLSMFLVAVYGSTLLALEFGGKLVYGTSIPQGSEGNWSAPFVDVAKMISPFLLAGPIAKLCGL